MALAMQCAQLTGAVCSCQNFQATVPDYCAAASQSSAVSRHDLPLQNGDQDALKCYIDVASVVVSIVLVLLLCVWAWQILAHEVGLHCCSEKTDTGCNIVALLTFPARRLERAVQFCQPGPQGACQSWRCLVSWLRLVLPHPSCPTSFTNKPQHQGNIGLAMPHCTPFH